MNTELNGPIRDERGGKDPLRRETLHHSMEKQAPRGPHCKTTITPLVSITGVDHLVLPVTARNDFLYTFLTHCKQERRYVYLSTPQQVALLTSLFSLFAFPVVSLPSTLSADLRAARLDLFATTPAAVLITDLLLSVSTDRLLLMDFPDFSLPIPVVSATPPLLVVHPPHTAVIPLMAASNAFAPPKLARVQDKITKTVATNYAVHLAARDAYRSYILYIHRYPDQSLLSLNNLNLINIANAFGLENPTKVRLGLFPRAPLSPF